MVTQLREHIQYARSESLATASIFIGDPELIIANHFEIIEYYLENRPTRVRNMLCPVPVQVDSLNAIAALYLPSIDAPICHF